jgi:uncharacterized protein YhaN
MSEPSDRVQTRPTNINQHPGNVIQKRKRRTKTEMSEARNQEQKEKEELETLRAEKVRDLAALEARISKKDKEEVAGTDTYMRPKPRPLAKKIVSRLQLSY